MLNNKELQSVLPKLADPGSRLVKHDDDLWRLSSIKKVKRAGQILLGAKSIQALVSQGLLTPSGRDGYVLSAAGYAAVRRLKNSNDKFRRQHQVRKFAPVKIDSGITLELECNLSESPLAWLRAHKDADANPHISDEQYRAGEQLRSEFSKAGYSPSVTASWSPTASLPGRKKFGAHGNRTAEVSDRALIARQRVQCALERTGPELSGILLEVCCYLNRIEDAEKKLGFPKRSGKLVLKLALTALSRHYGYISDDVSRGEVSPRIAQKELGAQNLVPK